MKRGKQMMAVELLVHLAVVKTNLLDQSRSVQLESGVRRKAHAPFGAGERLRNPTYRHPGCNPGSVRRKCHEEAAPYYTRAQGQYHLGTLGRLCSGTRPA